jgi:hypothetical protein
LLILRQAHGFAAFRRVARRRLQLSPAPRQKAAKYRFFMARKLTTLFI